MKFILISFFLALTSVSPCFSQDQKVRKATAEEEAESKFWMGEDGKGEAKKSNKEADKTMQMATLSLALSSFLAPLYLKTCHNQPSTWIYGATAALYIAGEIANYSKYKNATEVEMLKYKEGADKQADAFDAGTNQTEAAAKAMARKVELARMAALGYTAASVMSVVEAVSPYFNGGVCTGDTGFGEYKHYAGKEQNKLNSSFNALNKFLFLVGERQSLGLREYTSFGASFKITSSIFGSLLGNAYAGFSGGADNSKQLQSVGILGGGASAAGVIYANVVVQQARDMVSAKMSGWARAAVFGANAGIGFMVGEQAAKSEKDLKKVSEKYAFMAQTYKNMSAMEKATQQNGEKEEKLDALGDIGGQGKMEVENSGGGVCFVQSGNDTLTDPTCSCKKNDSCKKAEFIMPKQLGFIKSQETKDAFSRSLGALNDYANKVYSGNLSGASIDGAQIGRYAASLKKIRDGAIAKINKKRIEKGLPPVDFDAEMAKKAKRQEAQVARALGAMDAKSRNALMAEASLGMEALNKAPEEALKAIKESKVATNGATDKGDKAESEKDQNLFGDYDFAVADAGANTINGAQPTADLGDMGNTEGEQIAEDGDGRSLFKIISDRYISSGYTRLFTRIK